MDPFSPIKSLLVISIIIVDCVTTSIIYCAIREISRANLTLILSKDKFELGRPYHLSIILNCNNSCMNCYNPYQQGLENISAQHISFCAQWINYHTQWISFHTAHNKWVSTHSELVSAHRLNISAQAKMFGGINNIYIGGYKYSAHKIYFHASSFICGEYFLDQTATSNISLVFTWQDHILSPVKWEYFPNPRLSSCGLHLL